MDAAVNETKDRLEAKLRYELGYDILKFLDDDDVYEVDVNGDGKIWVIKAGGHPSGEYSGYDLPFPARMSFLGTIAFMADKELNDKDPNVEGILPWNGARVTGVIPPSNLYGPNICIRKKATKIFSLQEYIDNDRMTLEDKEIIENAIRNKKNIVIAGPTGSGKTTFTNAIIDSLYLISPTDRILCLEDVAEIQVRHENKVCLKTTDEMDLEKLVKTAMRLTPDRIVIGEVRGKEALDLLTAWNMKTRNVINFSYRNSS